MKLQCKLTNKEWEEAAALGPGVHTFRQTLFCNKEKQVDENADGVRPLIYNIDIDIDLQIQLDLNQTFIHILEHLILLSSTPKVFEIILSGSCACISIFDNF